MSRRPDFSDVLVAVFAALVLLGAMCFAMAALA